MRLKLTLGRSRRFIAESFGLIAVWGLAACSSPPSVSSEARAQSSQPNIILIVADDLGVNDLSINGNILARTPNIDALARRGTYYATAYATSPVCATSRAALLTGRYQQTFGVESNPSSRALARRTVAVNSGSRLVDERRGDPPTHARGLPEQATTLAEHLRDHGYRTGLIGKWHLGRIKGMHPNDQGFEHFFGFLGGASMFAERDDPDVIGAELTWNGLDQLIWDRLTYSLERNGEPVASRVYQTTAFTDEAITFVSQPSEQPFFLMIAYNAPHNPLQAPSRHYQARADIAPHHRRVYYAMIDSLDEEIGRLMTELDQQGLASETIIVFTSDNGGAEYVHVPEVNAPLRGYKASMWEGGIRVPLIVTNLNKRGPSRVTYPVSLLDIFPTLLSAAGLAGAPDLNGRNLPGADAPMSPRTLFWKNNDLWAARNANWKMIHDGVREKSWLYDLSLDPHETRNLIGERPDIATALKAEYQTFRDDLPETPLWLATYLMPVPADSRALDEGERLEPDDWSFWPG